MCHSRNTTIIANAFAEAERRWLLLNDVLKHHHYHCHKLGVVWLDWVPLLQSISRINVAVHKVYVVQIFQPEQE